MASKLDTLLLQLSEIADTLQKDEDQRVIKILKIVQELAQHIIIVQKECITLLQSRNIEDKTNPQSPFRWDVIRSDTSPFKAPYTNYFD